MRIRYYAKVHRDPDSLWIEFPDLDGCATQGDDMADLRFNAQEALDVWLLGHFDLNWPVPRPKAKAGRNMIAVSPSPEIAASLELRWMREDQGYSQAAVASRLGISPQAYQKLEHPEKFNPTYRTLQRLGSALGRTVTIEWGPVNGGTAGKRIAAAPGRPKVASSPRRRRAS